MGLLKHDDKFGDALTVGIVGGHFCVEGNKIFRLHTSTVEVEVLNELLGRHAVEEGDWIFKIFVESLVNDVADEFCDSLFGGEEGGVVGEEELVRSLHPVSYNQRCIVLDFVIVGGWTVRDGEGGSPRCCVGAGRLDKAHEIVLTVAIVVKVLEEWF